ncbi:MAG: tRNA uridine-5-carboxymethylaminomethyl(34) synthesis enzyme MnmG [Phycisphaerales bacterium]
MAAGNESNLNPKVEFDVIVVGGGHAGAEAAWAAAALVERVALVTMKADKIGAMSCNPAIGGLAKGQMVREIDALGGIMGRAIDATGIQFRMLNTSRGAAVHGPRAQADKYAYAREVQRLLATRSNIEVLEGLVDRFVVDDRGRCVGVETSRGELRAQAVVLTTGTFMRGLMHTGERRVAGGRVGEGSAEGISGELRRLGFELGRLKTGTPPRLAKESIDFGALKPQPGDDDPIPFSELTTAAEFPRLPQVCCHETHTNEAIHELIRANLDRAPMYSGQIDADCGPRYCPSIEDKVVRFADRAAHHVFLEPESLDTNEVYCNGISTSLPRDVQDEIVRALPGCERARILQYGYAVEYDMVWPHQIDATTMTKRVEGLFLAGQINGTSGYEEAGGQGLVAGLNAARFARNEEPVRFGRDTSYIGVMLDDLVTKTPREPYRMFTSRAEHRLLLRADNAPDRLTPLGRDFGLVDDERWTRLAIRQNELEQIAAALEEVVVEGRSLADLARGGQIGVEAAVERLHERFGGRLISVAFNDARYEAYIARQQAEIHRLSELERKSIPTEFEFGSVRGLRNEAVETLRKFRPATLGQAGRLAGVNPADVTLVAIALKAWRRERAARVSA